MEFIDLNRYGEIGSNSTFLSIGSFNILIDSGLHPKKLGKDSLPDFNKIQGKTIDLIILTHCHLDHLGSLPIIARNHPEASNNRHQRHLALDYVVSPLIKIVD